MEREREEIKTKEVREHSAVNIRFAMGTRKM